MGIARVIFLTAGCKLGYACGDEMDSPIVSSAEGMYIAFITDKGTEKSGFKLTLTATGR